MTGNKLIAIFAAVIAGCAALAVSALFIDWGSMFAPPATEERPAAGEAPSAKSTPQAATPAEEPGTKPAEATGALTPPSEPTTVPTFDVVVIDPSGEGVIAGRAAPGWKVSVQSGGTKVAEAKVDLQGEWSVVLEKPLPSGDHALSLKITSPDGTRALSSQETVRVAVGSAVSAQQATGSTGLAQTPQAAGSAGVAQSTRQATASAELPSESAPQTEAVAPPADPNAHRALARSEQVAATSQPEPGGTAAAPPKPKIVFKTVDYIDGKSGTGTVTITGTSEPGAKLSLFQDNKPLAETRADDDGHWSVQVAKTLSLGQHNFRVERSGAPPGMAGAAYVSIERAEPKPEPPASVVASKETASPKVATDGSASNPLIYIIRKGDTLWAIAKRYLGSGLRYPSIFEDNRQIIHNPDLIHPQQEVKVPPS
jgi:nucleoid-associated protein YgaU